MVKPQYLLQKLRDKFYSGHLRYIVRQIGLNKILSDPYWKLVYVFSGKTQTHDIDGHKIEFKTDTFTEFMRFRSFAGEEAILKDLLQSLKKTDIVYDVGANVGTYTCFAAMKLQSQQTVAFEPESRNAERLRGNLELNNLDARVLEVALSDTNGTIDFALSGDEAGEGEHAIATDQATETIEVETVRGDRVIEERDLTPPSVVKIDVEGAELSVLRGLSETLRENVRLAYVEVHSEKLPAFGDSAPEVRAFLEGAGFDVTELSSDRSEFFLRASK
ncbi:FkbM family methyltransferase [Halostagnicola larsenii]|nr:FkbM family methyltransferase [Halostagnicola larsenii]